MYNKKEGLKEGRFLTGEIRGVNLGEYYWSDSMCEVLHQQYKSGDYKVRAIVAVVDCTELTKSRSDLKQAKAHLKSLIKETKLAKMLRSSGEIRARLDQALPYGTIFSTIYHDVAGFSSFFIQYNKRKINAQQIIVANLKKKFNDENNAYNEKVRRYKK